MSPDPHSDSSSDDDEYSPYLSPSHTIHGYRTKAILPSTCYGRLSHPTDGPTTAAFPSARDSPSCPSDDRSRVFPSYPSIEWHWCLYAIHGQEEDEGLRAYLDRSLSAALDLELGSRGAEETAIQHILRGLLPTIKGIEEVFDVALLSQQMILEELQEELLLAAGALSQQQL